MTLLKRNFLFSVFFSLFINLPTYGVSLLVHQICPALKWGYLGVYIPFFFAIISLRSVRLRTSLLAFFMILEIIQMCHMAYFGGYISPLRFEELFTEMDEILLSGTHAVPYLWYVPLIAALPWACFIFCLKKWPPQPLKGTWILVFGALLFMVGRTYVRPMYDAYPHPKRFSLINSLNSLGSYVTKFLPLKLYGHLPTYEPYQITVTGSTNNNIVLVLGESFSPDHMSLFGYDIQTTPLLETLKENPNFIYKIGYSASINTRQSCLLLANMVREPFFASWIEGKKTNLFRLAKEQGYTTYYISGQKLSLLRDIGVEFIDHVITVEDAPDLFAAKSDQALIALFEHAPQSEKYFVVLHQRCAHAPYESHYQHVKDESFLSEASSTPNEYRRVTYDNAVRFNDMVLHEIITYFTKKSHHPTYILMTSDHGERLGEQGKWGHGFLDEGVATVPFMAYIIKGSEDTLAQIRALHYPTHYELGKLMASLMGYHIQNPNEVAGRYTIIGSNLFGLEGYIEIDKMDTNAPPALTTHHPR